MTSKIKMINNALLLVGDNAISGLDDPGFGSTVADNLYEDTYAAILACHPWSFAFKEQWLSQLSASPDVETGYQYAYRVPVDSIRIWQLIEHSDYEIIGNLIYSNLSKVLCRYIHRVLESQIPPQVAKAIEYKLAAEFAVSVTDNDRYAQIYEQKYINQLGQAQAIDSQNRPQSQIIDAPFADVRFSGRGIYSTGGF